ncbi:cilia- and flagella-associated protein 58-like [Aphidius gifuensis]|uniref:cilia- and flagella-associated protein 58-like n=1 Tax=Aphidius gifuensis TaxID=684658 RepID=UPI001CDC40F2|nr:cilia- and flagella-associated protein 58-like [Aphidius gifuensis]
MEMEMNAEMERDDSDSGEPSAVGSSAGSIFCSLEKDYARILDEMKTNEALSSFEAEYTRLFEMLYKCRRDEENMMEGFRQLQDSVIDKTSQIYELKKKIESQGNEMSKLKDEIVGALKLADAAHTREQNSQEIIENLRLSIFKLNHEIEQRNRQLALDEKNNRDTKQKENYDKEKEKLTNELETVRQRLKCVNEYNEELEKKLNTSEQQINVMQENIDVQSNEISKERIIRERIEREFQELMEEFNNRNIELQSANTTIQTATTNLTKLDNSLREQKNTNDKLRKEMNKLMVGKMNLRNELDNANRLIGEMEKSIKDKEKDYKLLEHEIRRLKEEAAKCKAESTWMSSKYAKIDNVRVKVEKDLEHVKHSLKNAEIQVQALNRQIIDEKKINDNIIREKNELTKQLKLLKDNIKNMQQLIDCNEQNKRKIQMDLDQALNLLASMTKKNEALEKEREKFNQDIKNLMQQIDDHANQLKSKDYELMDYKKQLSDLDIKFLQQQNLFEAVRSEKNTYSKNLSTANDDILEQREKIKLLNGQIEQLKEIISAKESNTTKGEFLLGKAEKEKESARLELQSAKKELFDLRRELENNKKEEKNLRQNVKKYEMDINRLEKDIDMILNERDILGTQIVRRNDELSLQSIKLKELYSTLRNGEKKYAEKIDDIRLLKLEIKKLNTEKLLLDKSLKNNGNLKIEVFHLDRDLTRERLKVIALEEEIQNPMNIHRWRKLEGSDPSSLELIKKLQCFQKRIIKMNNELTFKDEKIKHSEKCYLEIFETIMKQPSQEIIDNFEKTKNTLRERENKIKGMLGELNMWESRANEYKYELDNVVKELRDLKNKYYLLKKENNKNAMKNNDVKNLNESFSSLPQVTSSQKKFFGGGFTMTVAPSRNCYSLETVRK